MTRNWGRSLYVCKPSPYFFDSKEKLDDYLLNVQELVDRDFDVKIIYQDENGQYRDSKINDALSFFDQENKIKLASSYLLFSDPIDIHEAKKQLKIVHDSSLFLDDSGIHKSKTTIEFCDEIPEELKIENTSINFLDLKSFEEIWFAIESREKNEHLEKIKAYLAIHPAKELSITQWKEIQQIRSVHL